LDDANSKLIDKKDELCEIVRAIREMNRDEICQSEMTKLQHENAIDKLKHEHAKTLDVLKYRLQVALMQSKCEHFDQLTTTQQLEVRKWYRMTFGDDQF
jgi:hypothetical protein